MKRWGFRLTNPSFVENSIERKFQILGVEDDPEAFFKFRVPLEEKKRRKLRKMHKISKDDLPNHEPYRYFRLIQEYILL